MHQGYDYWPGVPGLYEGFYFRKTKHGYEYIGKDMKKVTTHFPPEEFIWEQTPWR